jgi:ABC-2 type transport system permease protein
VSIARVLAVARRIAQGFRRDERTLGLVFVVPIVVTALLGWVLRDQMDATVRVAVAGAIADQAAQSRLETIAAESGIDLEVRSLGLNASIEDVRAAVRAGRADVGILIPIQYGGPPAVQVVTEGADPAAESGMMGALQMLLLRAFEPSGSGLLNGPPTFRHETVYLSPDADTLDVLAPVFLGYFGYFFVFLLTGISFLRERVGGTLDRLLATPVTRVEIVLGYSLGFGLFATLQVIVLTLFVLARIDVPAIGPIPAFTIGLDVQSVGNPVLAFFVALVLSLGAVNLGVFLSTFARTELQIIQFIPLVIVPQGLLGGIFWPVDRLPDILQVVARALPMTYAVDGLREVMLKGAGLGSAVVQGDLAVLAGIAVLFVALAAGTIKREVA